jgi:hypothetical protein
VVLEGALWFTVPRLNLRLDWLQLPPIVVEVVLNELRLLANRST